MGCDSGKLRQAKKSTTWCAPKWQVRAMEQHMLWQLKQRDFTPALNMYRAIERYGMDRGFTEELYSAFIQSAIRVGKVDVVEQMLRAINQNEMTPSLGFWQSTLKMLCIRSQFSACLAVHSLCGSQLPTDRVVFSCLINAALEVGRPELVEPMLERYGDAGLEPEDYVLTFRTYYALRNVDAAEKVFRELGGKATTIMLNLLLSTCVSVRQPRRGLGLLREAHGLERHLDKKVVDNVSYNTVIRGFQRAGQPGQCLECLHAMHVHGVEPDNITYGTLLEACVAGNDMFAAHAIIMRCTGSDRPMDAAMCTAIIKGLAARDSLPKALALYEEMRRRGGGAHPDRATYAVLIKALVDRHDLRRALELVDDMASGGQSPDHTIFAHLLEGCRHAGDHGLGKQLFKDMLEAGVKPSEVTLVTMLELHGQCGAHEEAYDLVADLGERRRGFRPSLIHYTCLMSGCLSTKSYDQAWAAYELMVRNGVQADEAVISTLLPGMVAARQWDRVQTLERQLERQHGSFSGS